MLFTLSKHSLFKKTLLKIHLALALLSGFFLINLSLSGALLLYAKDIQTLINPQYWQLTENKSRGTTQLLTLSALTQKIEEQTEQQIQFIQLEESEAKPWQVLLVNNHYLSVNPYTGNILLTYQLSETFYGFMMCWHRWLLYTTDNNEKPMQLWVAIASLILIIELIVGVFIWAKPKHRIKRLKIRLKASNKIRFTQLHGTLGVFFCVPLMLIAFSGIAFFWPKATKQVVELASFSKVQQRNYQYIELPNQENNRLNKAYNVALSALSDGQVYRIYFPKNANSTLALRIKMPNESHAYSWSWANYHTGEFLNSFDASNTSIATKIWNFKYKFHIGEFIGWPIKILWFFISLLPVFFILSGVYIWIRRKAR